MVLLSAEAALMLTQDESRMIAVRVDGNRLIIEPLSMPKGTSIHFLSVPKKGHGMVRFTSRGTSRKLPLGKIDAVWDDLRGRIVATFAGEAQGGVPEER